MQRETYLLKRWEATQNVSTSAPLARQTGSILWGLSGCKSDNCESLFLVQASCHWRHEESPGGFSSLTSDDVSDHVGCSHTKRFLFTWCSHRLHLGRQHVSYTTSVLDGVFNMLNLLHDESLPNELYTLKLTSQLRCARVLYLSVPGPGVLATDFVREQATQRTSHPKNKPPKEQAYICKRMRNCDNLVDVRGCKVYVGGCYRMFAVVCTILKMFSLYPHFIHSLYSLSLLAKL